MNYHFFDYKYNIAGFDSDLFSTPHLFYIVLIFLLVPLVSYFLRNAKREKITNALKILFFVVAALEIIKITWESYYDITTGQGFNTGGILPFYTCSLFIFTLPFAAWGKGKTKETALSFLCTIGLLFGGIGVVYCNGLNYYPFWTFGAFHSLFFHAAMFSTGVYLLISGYKKPTWESVLRSMIPILFMSLIAIPVNYALGCDYMSLYSGGGIPLYEDLATSLAAKGLRPIYTVIMLFTHLPLSALVTALSLLIAKIANCVRERGQKETPKKVLS